MAQQFSLALHLKSLYIDKEISLYLTKKLSDDG